MKLSNDDKSALLRSMVEIDRATVEATRQALSTERGRALFVKRVRAWIKDPEPGNPALYNLRRFGEAMGRGQKFNRAKALAAVEEALGSFPPSGSVVFPVVVDLWASARPHVDLLEECARAGGSTSGWYFCALLRHLYRESARLAIPIAVTTAHSVSRGKDLDDAVQDCALGVLHGVRSFSPFGHEGWPTFEDRHLGAIWTHLAWLARSYAVRPRMLAGEKGWKKSVRESLDTPHVDADGSSWTLLDRVGVDPSQFGEVLRGELGDRLRAALAGSDARTMAYATAIMQDHDAVPIRLAARFGISRQGVEQGWAKASATLRKRLGPDLRP